MLCGRCCVTEPPTKLALRLDIFIEILPCTPLNKGIMKGWGCYYAPVLLAVPSLECPLTRWRRALCSG
jgi:hypothetical protein